ncbi:MAG: chemotaxis protein [Zetaproteobacteria bacterium CG12_big_fil_rev_8_21_14_0_65_54_13]|nr:MAG: chemotaxis protein [Zetaproteobacteria bacterium CG12_big_fil_rev_8_21_14_0_65_54_13]PIX54274.1 MAG: chemotaxis protein [Zetaproteobacteria bacterium CG_4_10_14_3_um_filter_54_28]PJA30419.1 MAG: chemotaxis protein [Zetaproteobacteria bacterium CG_4_9_14_3_um_filter_54_145]
MDSDVAVLPAAKKADGEASLVDFLHTLVGGANVLIRSSQIREILRPQALTPVPVGPDHLLGLANIHGQIVCMIDLVRVTPLPVKATDPGGRTRFLTLRHPSMHAGVRVDDVLGIKRVPEDALLMDGLVTEIVVDAESLFVLDCKLLLHG